MRAPSEVKDRIKSEVGQFLVEQTLLSVGEAKSPVSGESFPSLSNKYRKFKIAEARGGIPNLELSGDMLNTFGHRQTASGITIGHHNTIEAEKSDGHNNFSGDSPLPKRRYLPSEGQNYKREIQSGIDKIIADEIVRDQTISRGELVGVTTKAALMRVLRGTFPNIEPSEIRGAVSRNPQLVSILGEFGLLSLL